VFSLIDTLLCLDLFNTTLDQSTILRSEFICICDQSSSLKLLLFFIDLLSMCPISD
jgi:hypothetical protein